MSYGMSYDPLHELNLGHKEQRETLLEMMKAQARMGITLAALLDLQTAHYQAEHESTFFLSTTEARMYSANGYKLNRVYVGDDAVQDGAKLVITSEGIKWTVTLTAGENVLNMPDGATYKATTNSGQGVNALLIRSNS